VKRTTSTANRRCLKAYTLIELIVVMGIIMVLAGLLIVMWPGLQSSTAAQQNADRIQGMLLIAKQRGLRDGRPTGVRLVLSDPVNDPYSAVSQLMYVQQPDPYTPPVISTTANGSTTVNIGTLQATQGAQSQLTFAGSLPSPSYPNPVDFTGGLTVPTDYLVQSGDYLEINGGGALHKIVTVAYDSVNNVTVPNILTVADTVSLTTPTTNWRIVRQPRPLAGEEPINLNGTIIIDLRLYNGVYLSQNVPLRQLSTDGTSPPLYFREIMFAPSGSVVSQGTSGNDKILLWVRDGFVPITSPPTKDDPTKGEPVLIGIQIGTGLIGGYPVDVTQAGGDYFSNTRDPHASGL
jgi:type II secretory pathway pseudopilin PulG